MELTKQMLRKQVSRNVRMMDAEERLMCSQDASRRFIASPVFSGANIILSYMAMEFEMDPLGVTAASLGSGKVAGVPYCVPGTNRLQFYRITGIPSDGQSGRQFRKGAWGILEPDTSVCREIVPSELHDCTVAVLVPGVAFTNEGVRLGHGKGYYDTFLEELLRTCGNGCRIICVGMCFSAQIVPFIPAESHDAAMQYLLTEKGLVSCVCT